MPKITNPLDGKTPEQKKNALYSQAMQEIRNRHEDEFFEIVEDLYTANGLTYKRRLTEAQKDEQRARAILAANPDLLARLVAEVAPAEVGEIEVTE